MADNTSQDAKLNEPFVGVTDAEYDGREFTHEDNKQNVSAYVGVDPIYQNYANEGEKPYPFSREELDQAAVNAGLDPYEDWEEEDDEEGDEVQTSTPSTPEPPKVTTQSTKDAPAPTRASAKDTKTADSTKK